MLSIKFDSWTGLPTIVHLKRADSPYRILTGDIFNISIHPDELNAGELYICTPFGLVAQLNRASDYGSEGFRFES